MSEEYITNRYVAGLEFAVDDFLRLLSEITTSNKIVVQADADKKLEGLISALANMALVDGSVPYCFGIYNQYFTNVYLMRAPDFDYLLSTVKEVKEKLEKMKVDNVLLEAEI